MSISQFFSEPSALGYYEQQYEPSQKLKQLCYPSFLILRQDRPTTENQF